MTENKHNSMRRKTPSQRLGAENDDRSNRQTMSIDAFIKQIKENPESEESKQVLSLLAMSVREFRSGPLPSGEEFKRYEDTLKGAADRIIKMTEEEAVHRRETEREVVINEYKCRNKGLNYGIIACFMFVFVTGLAIYFHEPLVAAAIGCSSIASIVVAFIKGSNSNK